MSKKRHLIFVRENEDFRDANFRLLSDVPNPDRVVGAVIEIHGERAGVIGSAKVVRFGSDGFEVEFDDAAFENLTRPTFGPRRATFEYVDAMGWALHRAIMGFAWGTDPNRAAIAKIDAFEERLRGGGGP